MSETPGKRGPGRKPSDDPTTSLSVRLRQSVIDLLGPDPRGTLKALAEAEAERRRAAAAPPADPA
ncbi:hypothetical protein AB0425_17805 [Actinosynnema sp. NPDC051121]